MISDMQVAAEVDLEGDGVYVAWGWVEGYDLDGFPINSHFAWYRLSEN